jgi:hypothetical protein
LYNHATDFDTLRTFCLILATITVLDFTVYILHNACELYISIVPNNESHLQLGEVTYWRYFHIKCAKHPSYAYISGFELPSENKIFEMASSIFWKICGSQP